MVSVVIGTIALKRVSLMRGLLGAMVQDRRRGMNRQIFALLLVLIVFQVGCTDPAYRDGSALLVEHQLVPAELVLEDDFVIPSSDDRPDIHMASKADGLDLAAFAGSTVRRLGYLVGDEERSHGTRLGVNLLFVDGKLVGSWKTHGEDLSGSAVSLDEVLFGSGLAPRRLTSHSRLPS